MNFPGILVLFSAFSLVCFLPRAVPAQEMPEEMIDEASSDLEPQLQGSPEEMMEEDSGDVEPPLEEMIEEAPAVAAPPPQKQPKAPAPVKEAVKIRAEKEKPVPAAALPASGKVAPSDVMTAEWDFIKTCGESKDDDVAEAVLPQLSQWLKTYPEGKYSDEAMLLKAELQLRLGDYRSAVVTLIRHTQEYPDSKLADAARQQLGITIDKKLNKKIKDPLSALARAPRSEDKAGRLAAFIGGMADEFGEEFYAPVLSEFGGFFVRFPAYAGRDELQLSLGNLYARKGEYLPARLAYEKLIQVYPSSKYLVRAKKELGDVLANNLKDYLTAIKVYSDITVNFPGTDEAWAAYLQLPKLTEKQDQYGRAVAVYEEIIKLYPDKPEARDAFRSEARVLRKEMKNPAGAVAVLNRLADKYKDEETIKELYLAAEIARKDLRDIDAEVKMYDRIAAEYPDSKEAPKALMEAGRAFEKVKDPDRAIRYYEKIMDRYPDDSLAKKAYKYKTALVRP